MVTSYSWSSISYRKIVPSPQLSVSRHAVSEFQWPANTVKDITHTHTHTHTHTRTHTPVETTEYRKNCMSSLLLGCFSEYFVTHFGMNFFFLVSNHGMLIIHGVAGGQSTFLNGCKQNLWCIKCQCHLCFEALCNAKSAYKRKIPPVPQVSLYIKNASNKKQNKHISFFLVLCQGRVFSYLP